MRGRIYFSDDSIHCVGRGRSRGRHDWRASFGPGGASFEGDPGWGDMFRAGRALASGDIRLIVLSLLAEKPRHGYDIIKEIEERTRGFYAPSPGVVYPTLTYLEEVGYAAVEAEGAKKLYTVTEAGREYLAKNRAEADAVLGQLERMGEKMAHVRRWFDYDEAKNSRHSGSAVYEARRDLKDAVREKRGASGDELARVAEILKRAAKDIRGK